MTAVLITPANGTPQWLDHRRSGIGASEVAAVLGISPYESPFSLWWRKFMGWDIEATPEMRTGTYLEPTIADWYAQYHAAPAELVVRTGGLYAHPDRAWQLATPDRLLHAWGHCGSIAELHDDLECLKCIAKGLNLFAVLECKWVAYSWDGWGAEGGPDIPVHYRAQVQWQMDVMGVGSAAVCALGPGGFRVYNLLRDDKDITVMREAGQRFMTSLLEGEPPNVDDHTATLPMLRRVNDAIEDGEQEIPQAVAAGWLRSKRFRDLAERVERRYSAQLRAHMGTRKTAVVGGQPFAFRTAADQLRRRVNT